MNAIIDEFDPLFKRVIVTEDQTFIQFNFIEAIYSAPDEMNEILRQAMLEERANPTPENKAKAFDILKSMIGEYWANGRETVAKLREDALTA